ncbi:MAG TPA: ATP synthase F0 subunit A [Marinilabiliales bacterium]|nr:ATP synthase F0 subunit A [Marinilabiliales bacterium]
MKRIILLLSAMYLTSMAFANEEPVAEHQAQQEHQEADFDPTEVIMHHISDAHDWHLFDLTDKETGEKHAVSIPLPVILFYKGHLDVFLSSAFHHGESTVHKGEREYALYHNKIYAVTSEGMVFDEHEHPINPKPLDFSITKNVASLLFSALFLLLIFIPMARKYKKGNLVPSGLQGFLEPIVLFIKEDIAIPNIGEHKFHRFLPYLLTVFFFIWINNMLGLVPFFPGGANLTGNIAVTMTLAVFTLIITNTSGSKTYWGHVFAPPVPKWLWFIMIPVEMIGVLSKPFALMIRLFANITAGHIIVLSLVSLIFIFKTVWISPASIVFVLFMDVLELLVAILHAYIFTLLSALFIGLAVHEHH